MRTLHPIEQILGTRSRIAVLRVLWRAADPLNTSQIASRSRLTRPAAATALEELAQAGVVRSTSVGRAIVHTLDRSNAYTERYITPIFSAEDDMPEAMLDEIRSRFAGCAESAVLFGSYARSEQGPESDIDVALVAQNQADKTRLDDAVLTYEPEFQRRWGVSLSALTYEAREARALWRTAPALYESMREEGLVIFGTGPWEWSDDE